MGEVVPKDYILAIPDVLGSQLRQPTGPLQLSNNYSQTWEWKYGALVLKKIKFLVFVHWVLDYTKIWPKNKKLKNDITGQT